MLRAEWSGIRESNSRLHLGKVAYYHYTNPAQIAESAKNLFIACDPRASKRANRPSESCRQGCGGIRVTRAAEEHAAPGVCRCGGGQKRGARRGGSCVRATAKAPSLLFLDAARHKRYRRRPGSRAQKNERESGACARCVCRPRRA